MYTKKPKKKKRKATGLSQHSSQNTHSVGEGGIEVNRMYKHRTTDEVVQDQAEVVSINPLAEA